jgi:hypothetical protein
METLRTYRLPKAVEAYMTVKNTGGNLRNSKERNGSRRRSLRRESCFFACVETRVRVRWSVRGSVWGSFSVGAGRTLEGRRGSVSGRQRMMSRRTTMPKMARNHCVERQPQAWVRAPPTTGARRGPQRGPRNFQ